MSDTLVIRDAVGKVLDRIPASMDTVVACERIASAQERGATVFRADSASPGKTDNGIHRVARQRPPKLRLDKTGRSALNVSAFALLTEDGATHVSLSIENDQLVIRPLFVGNGVIAVEKILHRQIGASGFLNLGPVIARMPNGEYLARWDDVREALVIDLPVRAQAEATP